MFDLFYPLVRFFLFKFDAEVIHDFTIRWLRRIQHTPLKYFIRQKAQAEPVDVLGIQFPNKVGLAAGLDKNGQCIDAFAEMGFGHIEVGTVTPRPQPGNPKPRCFRLKSVGGIINRFGFNNLGVDALVDNVKASRFDGVLGINIGKNFDTPVESAVDDYMICLEKVYPYASYIVVNISSPNTANLRELQFGEALESLLEAIKNKQAELTESHGKRVPVLVKIAPDLNHEEIDHLAETFKKHQVDGVIATNTTFSREPVAGLPFAEEQGGLSGAPLFESSTQVLKRFCDKVDGAFPVIGVGGIDSAESAQAKLDAGACLVQIYSGFIFEGPGLVKRIAKGVR